MPITLTENMYIGMTIAHHQTSAGYMHKIFTIRYGAQAFLRTEEQVTIH